MVAAQLPEGGRRRRRCLGLLFAARLWPVRFSRSFRRERAEFAYGMRAGAALMWGWTALLLWADRRPLERKGVLPLAMVVIAGLMANDECARRAGHTWAPQLAPTRLLQLCLLLLLGASYRGSAAPGGRDARAVIYRGAFTRWKAGMTRRPAVARANYVAGSTRPVGPNASAVPSRDQPRAEWDEGRG
jgi:hypothetical protein